MEKRDWIRDRESDTWKQTAMLRYLGKFLPNDQGNMMTGVRFNILTPPNNNQFISISRNESNDPNEEYYDDFRQIIEKDYNKIVFRDPVIINVRHFAELSIPLRGFELIPDTPVGSTLEHTLDQIYREMYGLSDDDELLPAIETVGYNPTSESFAGLFLTDNGSYNLGTYTRVNF